MKSTKRGMYQHKPIITHVGVHSTKEKVNIDVIVFYDECTYHIIQQIHQAYKMVHFISIYRKIKIGSIIGCLPGCLMIHDLMWWVIDSRYQVIEWERNPTPPRIRVDEPIPPDFTPISWQECEIMAQVVMHHLSHHRCNLHHQLTHHSPPALSSSSLFMASSSLSFSSFSSSSYGWMYFTTHEQVIL